MRKMSRRMVTNVGKIHISFAYDDRARGRLLIPVVVLDKDDILFVGLRGVVRWCWVSPRRDWPDVPF